MRVRGIPESQLRLWIYKDDVPTSFRANMRCWLEDWLHANPKQAVGIRP